MKTHWSLCTEEAFIKELPMYYGFKITFHGSLVSFLLLNGKKKHKWKDTIFFHFQVIIAAFASSGLTALPTSSSL